MRCPFLTGEDLTVLFDKKLININFIMFVECAFFHKITGEN